MLGISYALSRDADLAAIKARYESDYTLIASDPKIANNPLVIAALANAKASDAAFYAALENMEAKRTFLHRWNTYRHFRQASLKAEKAHDALRATVEGARVNLKWSVADVGFLPVPIEASKVCNDLRQPTTMLVQR